MAKEKKRGFFSWLGFGKEEEKQQPAETPEQQPEEPALAQAEADAAHTVEVTEQVAEAQRDAAPGAETVDHPAEDAAIIAPPEEIVPEEEPALAPQPEAEEMLPETLPKEEQPLDDDELAALALAQAPQDEAAAEVIAEETRQQHERAAAEAARLQEEAAAAEAARRQEEAAAAEAARRQEEAAAAEAARRQQEAAAAEAARRQQEAAAAEAARRQEEAAAAEAARRQEEAAAAEAARRQQEAAAAEAARRQEEAAAAEEARRQEEAAAAEEARRQDEMAADAARQQNSAQAEAQDTVSDLPLAAAPIVAQEQDRPTKEGFFARLKRSLVKTRQNLGSGFISLFRGKKIDDDLFEELEEQLLIADVGVETTRRIITNLTQQANRKQLRDAEALYGLLKAEMSGILAKVDAPLDVSGKAPFVILMVGVNGVGKTTTIGKLARQYQAQGKSVMLAAGDTFRAAAVEQLQVWGERNQIPVVAQHTGADSASVIFDAIQAAKARSVDVLIADTAGRLQNKSHLMEELKKITRVMKKLDVDAPHEVMLTIDASTGQNAISQAKLFHEAVGLTGITLTKLDGTAKGGVIFSVADQFGIPIRYIGVGEGIEDLRPFKAEDFIEALFARED